MPLTRRWLSSMKMIGRRVSVNLSVQEWKDHGISLQTMLKRGGGTGLALEFFSEISESRDEESVVFAPGMMAGTNAPAAHWCAAAYRDPLKRKTMISYFGGHWGAGLKQAGIGILEIFGQAPFLTLLVVENGEIRFLDANGLAGLSTNQTHRSVETLLGDGYQIACIGPAGEKKLPFSSLVFEGGYQRNSAGLGAVMARLGVKAIAVKGNVRITPASPQEFFNEARGLRECFAQIKFPFRELSAYGSSYFLGKLHAQALLPIKNFTTSALNEVDELLGKELYEAAGRLAVACSGCPVGCRSRVKIGDSWVEAPGIEEIIALGTLCGIQDLKTIFRLKTRCDSLGLDPISIGGVLACWMEEGEEEGKGPFRFGDGKTALELLNRKDLSGIMERLGPADLDNGQNCIGSKLIGFMNTDPRGDPHLAINRLTWPFAEPHLLGSVVFLPAVAAYQADKGETDVASAVIDYQDLSLGLEALGFCPWSALSLGPAHLDNLVRTALGVEVPQHVVTRLGRDIIRDLGPRISSQTEIQGKHTSWFQRFSITPIPDGPRKGQLLHLEPVLTKYVDKRNKQL